MHRQGVGGSDAVSRAVHVGWHHWHDWGGGGVTGRAFGQVRPSCAIRPSRAMPPCAYRVGGATVVTVVTVVTGLTRQRPEGLARVAVRDHLHLEAGAGAGQGALAEP